MPRQNAAITLVNIALIFTVNAEDKSELSTDCVPFGEICHLHRPCCGNYKCDLTDTFGRFECQEKVKLGDKCKCTADCVDILHSVCTKKKCQCRQGNVRVNDHACAPLLNTYCWKNETCAPENSLCIDNECQCKDGFVAEAGECLPAVIGSRCIDDEACASVRFAECSKKKLCACSMKTIATSRRLCSVALGETCNFDRDCGFANSWCDNNKCQCRSQFIAYSNIECRLPYLGMTCEDSDKCRANIINSICINNVCICEDSHTLQDGNTCVATRILYCENDEECVEMNGVCVDGRCQCSVNYVRHESKCLPAKLEGRCRINSDCSAVNFALCIKGKCACGKGFFVLNAKACVKALGKSCISDKECGVRFSSCYDKKCQCNHGYTQHSENQCRATELGTTCFDNNTCILIKNAHCFESQCSCKENHIEMNALTCAPLLNAFCNNDLKCVPENSVCIDHKCQCEFSYFPKSNYECVLMYLELQCRSDKDCSNIRFAKCSPVRKCVCHKNYVRTGRTTCSPTLGGYCTSNGECVVINGECSKNQCRCFPGYTPHSDDICLPVFLGRNCDIDEDCDEISNTKCSHRRCQCKEGYIKFDRQVCLPLIGTRCTEHKECAVYNSNCIDNTCQCLETYIPQSQYECLPTGIDSLCYNDDDCQAVNTHCSRFNYCVCNTNFISVDNMTCATILGARCRQSVPCITPNSGCIGNTCQCNQGFVRGPFNDCVSVTLGSTCVINRDCKNIPNAICIDKKCACKPDTFALTPSACTQLLNTTCSSSADCGIETSHCVLNKCQCKPDWVAMTDTLCAKRSLLYHCDNALDCGEPWHSKCFQNRCVCNEHHIAVNELTCLPTLGGACWRDDQCMSDNTVCINYKCRCKHGFVSVAINMCVPS